MVEKIYNDILISVNDKLKEFLIECSSKVRFKLENGLTVLNPSNGHYSGIWPDDFLFPLIVCPELLNTDELAKTLAFITDSVVGLNYVPDRIEIDGLPILSPGFDNAISYRMPIHLPAAWVRLLWHMESLGISIPEKGLWSKIIRRSFDNITFACGLVYIDPQRPHVGFGYQDNIAVTGLELMSSLVIYRGLKRAVPLFKDYLDANVLQYWSELADRIKNNILKLYDSRIGGLVAGSRDCRQFSVWGNGLAYGLLENDNISTNIVNFYEKNQEIILRYGFTRHIAEENGWQRLLVPLKRGMYMNGGYWPTGTGYILPAIFDKNRELAIKIVTELVENLPKFDYSEWVDFEGKESGAKSFLMAVALPMLAIKAILEQKPLIYYF